jgi:glycosyltransferase involved in cell wall biosynthesis
VTPQLTEEAQKENSSVDPAKFVTLTNGFDPSDFSGLCRTKRGPDTTIFSYMGTFYMGQSPETFLRALRGLLDDGHVKPEHVRVWFYGNVAFADGLFVPDLVRDLRLNDIVTVGSYLPREDALRLSAETDIALVFTEHYAFSSKLYNALACGSIILNIGSTGEVVELLAKTGRGVSVNNKSLPEIRNGILECIRRRGSAQNHPEPWRDASIQEFNFQHLTGRLAALLEGLA